MTESSLEIPKKILTISDHPLVPSGVGTQTRYVIEGLLKTKKYKFTSWGCAVKHPDYRIQKVFPELYGENWFVHPIDGYGSRERMRHFLLNEKPDAIVIVTDPRFYYWLFEMADEINANCPLLYWHVWDNDPSPDFNSAFYESIDELVPLSLKTYGLLQDLKKRGLYNRHFEYIPHAIPADVFKPVSAADIETFRRAKFGHHWDRKFVIFWNNRNARRKMTGDVIEAFSVFARKVGQQNVSLFMQTQTKDPEGQDVLAIARRFGIVESMMISEGRVSSEDLNMYYNSCDCTMNISCFPAGTKVTTLQGYQSIETISVGDQVLTHTGRYMPVSKTFSGMNSRPLYVIKATNCDPVTSTEKHPFLAVKKNDVNFLVNENIGNLRELARWVRADELEIGDYLLSSGEKRKIVQEQVLDVWKYARDKRYDIRSKEHNVYSLVDGKIMFNVGPHASEFSAHEKLLLDEDLAYILGEWVADGSTGSCDVSFNKRDRERAEILRQKYERVFGNQSYIFEASRCLIVKLRNAAVYSHFFVDHCGSYSEGKHIPEVIMQAPEKIQRAFLSGYMAGDGCVLTHPRYGTKINRARTISNSLACNLRTLLVSLGYCPSVHDQENSGSFKEDARIWTIEWRERKRDNNGSCRSWNDGHGVITRIFDIEKVPNEGVQVFNLEVAEDNSYVVADIVVHNSNEGFGLSTLESLFAGTPIIAHMTGGLQFQIGDWWNDLDDFSDQKKLRQISQERYEKKIGKWWGVPVFPSVRNCVGSQPIPYIYDDRTSLDDVVDALHKMYQIPHHERKKIGLEAREWAMKNFSMDNMINSWDLIIQRAISNWKPPQPRIVTI